MALDSSFRYGYIRKYSIVPQTDPALQDIDGPILPIKIRIFRKRIVCKVVPPKAIAPIVDAAILSKDGKQVRTRRKRKLTPAALMLKSKGRISTSSGDAADRGKTTVAADVPPADGTKPKRKRKSWIAQTEKTRLTMEKQKKARQSSPAQVQKKTAKNIATPRNVEVKVTATPEKVPDAPKASAKAKTKVGTKPAKKATTKKKKADASPSGKTDRPLTYLDMAIQACQVLKCRKGCSLSAITKYLVKEFPVKSNYLTSLKSALKKGVASGALIRVRASYKVSKQWLQQQKAKERAKKKKLQAKAKKKAEAVAMKKKKKTAQQKKREKELANRKVDDLILQRQEKRNKIKRPKMPEATKCEGAFLYAMGDLFMVRSLFSLLIRTCAGKLLAEGMSSEHWINTVKHSMRSRHEVILPFFSSSELARAIEQPVSTPLLDSIHMFALQVLLHYCTPPDTEDEENEEEEASDSEDEKKKDDEDDSRVVMTFSAVLYGPEVLDENSGWAPSWWRKALNECTWPEILRLYTLRQTDYVFASNPRLQEYKAQKKVPKKYQDLTPYKFVKALEKQSYGSLPVNGKLAMLTYLCDDMLCIPSVNSVVNASSETILKMQTEFNQEDMEERRQVRAQRQLEREKRQAAADALAGDESSTEEEKDDDGDAPKKKKRKRVRLLSLPLQLKKLERQIAEATQEDKEKEATMDFRDRKLVLNHRRQARQKMVALETQKKLVESKIIKVQRQRTKDEAKQRAKKKRRQVLLRKEMPNLRLLPLGVDRSNRSFWLFEADQERLYVQTKIGQWYFYSTVSQIQGLTAALNPLGIREAKLLEALQSEVYRLTTAIRRKDKELLKSNARALKARKKHQPAGADAAAVASENKGDNISVENLRVGDAIQLLWEADMTWYEGVVISLPLQDAAPRQWCIFYPADMSEEWIDLSNATFKFTRNAEESRAQKHREWRAAQQAVLLKTEKRNDHGTATIANLKKMLFKSIVDEPTARARKIAHFFRIRADFAELKTFWAQTFPQAFSRSGAASCADSRPSAWKDTDAKTWCKWWEDCFKNLYSVAPALQSVERMAMNFTRPTFPSGVDEPADGDEGGAENSIEPVDGTQWWEARARDTDDKLLAEVARMHFRVLTLWGSWKRREDWGIELQQGKRSAQIALCAYNLKNVVGELLKQRSVSKHQGNQSKDINQQAQRLQKKEKLCWDTAKFISEGYASSGKPVWARYPDRSWWLGEKFYWTGEPGYPMPQLVCPYSELHNACVIGEVETKAFVANPHRSRERAMNNKVHPALLAVAKQRACRLRGFIDQSL